MDSVWRSRAVMVGALVLLCLLMVSGCASTLKVDLELNKKFVPIPSASELQSRVYVIRQSTILGAARGLYVGLNDEIAHNIGSGQYCCFLIDKGINTVNLEQVVPFGYYRLDNRSEKDIFLYFEMTTGKFTEIERDLGITTVMKSKRVYQGMPKKNIGYATAMINPDLVGLDLMQASSQRLEPDAQHAVITFIRPQEKAASLGFGIWNKKSFLGSLKGQTYFQIKRPPGKYTFVGKSEHYSVIETEVEAGKNYYIQVAAGMGWKQAHIRLLPVTNKIKDDNLKQWIDGSMAMTLNGEVIDALVKERLAQAKPLVVSAIQRVVNGEAESRVLNVADGR